MSVRRPPLRSLSALGVLWGGMALASPPAPLTPRTPTGFSTVEQRHVYAPPDEGSFEIPMVTGGAAATEVLLEEPEMCRPDAKATARITYSKSRNEVVLEADFDGLPYRMSFTRPVDVSTPYNQFPVSIQHGKWQFWFVGRMLNFDTTFYYDATTLRLLGSEHDLPGGPPPNSIPVAIATMHMTSTPLFEGTPEGKGRARFVFRYDQMLDEQGKGGVYFSYTPYSLCKPDEYGPYYTDGGLPVSLAMNFDQVLQSIWDGFGMVVATSLEPDPKPSYLLSRDNPMIGWSGAYPNSRPKGYESNPFNGTLSRKTTCATRIHPAYTAAYYNRCATP
ncbi:hypothetical protein [Archangium sp.]|uniref:hypothetical protein n=1 Tax=Archangium sp. TaxID=1872627 RepID=UPI002ED9EB17